jgi:hypothetical protein
LSKAGTFIVQIEGGRVSNVTLVPPGEFEPDVLVVDWDNIEAAGQVKEAEKWIEDISSRYTPAAWDHCQFEGVGSA